MFAILSKEFKSYFYSATAYIFMGVFLLITGIFFAIYNLLSANSGYTNVLSSISFIFLILVPILTMRIISEETKQKTDQLLLTAPVTVTDIVVGKYFAAVGLFLITLLITVINPLILRLFGDIEVAHIIGSYIGFALLGSCFISVGIFISALTDNQVVAAAGTFGALLILWIIDGVSQSLPTTSISGAVFALILLALLCLIIYNATKNVYVTAIIAIIGLGAIGGVFFFNKALFEGFTVKFIGWLSLLKRYDKFSMGILDVSSIVYYITFSFTFVFLTIRMIEKRRWS